MTDIANQLRPATFEDLERLLQWRNQPFYLKNSTSQSAVTSEEHHAWFTRALSNPDQLIFIVVQGDEPIGQVRFDRNKDIAVISVYLIEERTGKGLRDRCGSPRDRRRLPAMEFEQGYRLYSPRQFARSSRLRQGGLQRVQSRLGILPAGSFHLPCV